MSVVVLILLVLFLALLLLLALLLFNAIRLKPSPISNPLAPAGVFGDDRAVERFQAMLQSQTVWPGDAPGGGGDSSTAPGGACGAHNPDAHSSRDTHGAQDAHDAPGGDSDDCAPSSSDYSAFDEFLPKLQRLYPQVFASLELTIVNGYGLLLRWPGRDAGAAPVVLMAHHDVVVANAEDWTHPPFAAEIANGRIYARGAVDTKCILAGLLEATDLLLSQAFVPPRDIYICSSNSEEVMGATGKRMADHFSERGITPLFVLDEGGAVIDNAPLGANCEFAAIGVAEKGVFSAHCTVRSLGGHAATPSPADATAKLVKALNSIVANPAPARISKPVELMLRELAAHSGFGLKLVFANLWLFRPLVLAIMKRSPETAAMVRTTYAITQLAGSKAMNVIPKTASATVNVRVDPNETVALALARLKGHFDEADAGGPASAKDETGGGSGSGSGGGADIANTANTAGGSADTYITSTANTAAASPSGTDFKILAPIDPSPISPFDDQVFDYLRRVTHSVYPTAGIAPYIQSSASDARHFARIAPHTYRFAGFLFRGDQRARIHGVDENLDVDSFKRGVGFYVQLIRHLDEFGS